MALYKKPDVEVFQEFINPVTPLFPASLQAVVVGPFYQLFTEEVIGTYDDGENVYVMPSGLLTTSEIDLDSVVVSVNLYGDIHPVSKSVIRESGTTGEAVIATPDFVDGSVDFLAADVVPHSTPTANDGDYLYIPAGNNNGYYKILDVVDSHTLLLGKNFAVTYASENYKVISLGYTLEDENTNLRISPELGFTGDVRVSLKALRKEELTRPYVWDSVENIEETAGEGQVVYENPLPYNAALALTVMGQNNFIYAMPTEGTDATSYQKAFEVLENIECYAIAPLTQNPQVHQMLKAHVEAMSAPEEKKERIGLINTGWFEYRVKSGFFDIQDPADGQTTFGGVDDNDVVLSESAVLDSDTVTNSHVFSLSGVGRVIFNFGLLGENIAAGGACEYELTSAPGVWNVVGADADDYHAIALAPGLGTVGLDPITAVRYTSASLTDSITILGLETENEVPDYVEYEYLTVSGEVSGVVPQSDLITIDAGHLVAGKAPLSAMPIDPAQVKASIVGIQNFNYGADYIVTESGGTWYVEWVGRTMEKSVALGQKLKASYTVGISDLGVFQPAGGLKALKVRKFSAGGANPNPLADSKFPDGVKLYVITQSGFHTIERAGTYNFTLEILAVYMVTSTTATLSNPILNTDIELMVFEQAGTYERNRFKDLDANFISQDGVVTGDFLVLKSGSDQGTYKITRVVSNVELEVDALFSTFESNLSYEVRDTTLSKAERAEWYRDISAGYQSRRITHVFAPWVGISNDGATIEQREGYHACALIAGMIQVMAPPAGFTNLTIPGFVKVWFTNDYFLEKHLDTIASGGTFILAQPNVWTAPFCRHQQTTNVSQLEKRELSVVKDIDYMAKVAREAYRPYIGRFLVNDITMTTLYSVGNSLTSRFVEEGLANSAAVDCIEVDANQRDRVIICFRIEAPVPLNYIKLIFYI